MELQHVLKPTGSIYLHCDPTASHYLKMLMDAVFGPVNFVNEVIWKRTTAHSDAKQGATHFGRVHDVLLFYQKEPQALFHAQWVPYDQEYIESHYRYVEESTGRRYRKDNLTANRPGGDTLYEWNGVGPYKGRYWAFSKEKMAEFEAHGRLIYTRSGMPEYKRYLDEMPGRPTQDMWEDIPPINSQAAERLGYPTQKPEALLDRIIKASSDEGDTILDPFCGCGTAIAVSQRLNRQWIGIDITHLAITLIKHRLQDAYGTEARYKVIGEPEAMPDAVALATQDPYQFQWWALGLVGARPVERKKGADQGIDGRIFFHDEGKHGRTKQIILSVKSGHLKPRDLRDLRGVLQREAAQIGVLISLQTPTKPMRTEAASAGYYASPWGNHPTLQLLTIADLFDGKGINYPGWVNVTYKAAPKAKHAGSDNRELAF